MLTFANKCGRAHISAGEKYEEKKQSHLIHFWKKNFWKKLFNIHLEQHSALIIQARYWVKHYFFFQNNRKFASVS